jgi:hypothetical protein
MKYQIIIILFLVLIFNACTDADLYPCSKVNRLISKMEESEAKLYQIQLKIKENGYSASLSGKYKNEYNKYVAIQQQLIAAQINCMEAREKESKEINDSK